MNDENWDDLFKRAVQMSKETGYTLPADQIKDESPIGCLVAGYFEHIPYRIYVAMLHALEDANFYSLIPQLIELWNKQPSNDNDQMEYKEVMSLRKTDDSS